MMVVGGGRGDADDDDDDSFSVLIFSGERIVNKKGNGGCGNNRLRNYTA